MGTGRRAKAVLAVGTAAALGTGRRYAVHSAVALLTLAFERSRALQEAEQRLGAAVLRMLLSGEADHARAVAGRLYGSLLDAPMRVVIAEPAAHGASRNRAGGSASPAAPPRSRPSGAPVEELVPDAGAPLTPGGLDT